MSVSLSLHDKDFNEKSKFSTQISLEYQDVKASLVHQVVKATLAGKRQGSACTKTRAEVAGGGAKPFKQKGTGRARQGSSRSPLLVGGGVAFGPRPRSFKQKINKKSGSKAIQAVLADKLKAGKLFVVEKFSGISKTKSMFSLLSSKNLLPALVVFDDEGSQEAFLAARNLKRAKASFVKTFSVYDAVKFENLIIEKGAFDFLQNKIVLRGSKK